MPRYSEEVIRILVANDLHGQPWEWEIELDLPDDDPWSHGFQAWGRNRSFTPKWIRVSRRFARAESERPSTIRIEVRSKIRSDTAPIELELPWPYAATLARTIIKAARSLDHAALDAIAERLDAREWSGADDLEAIATLVRHTGREVRDLDEADARTVADGSSVDQPQLTATVSGDQVTVSRGTSTVLGIDMQSRTVGH
jgi:hypothetical protein